MTRDQKIYRYVDWTVAVIVAAVMLAGYYKILYPADFAVAVYRFHLLPGFLVNAAALYVPWLELVCAFCLLFLPRLRAAALWLVLGLLIVFTLAIGINLWRGSVFGCGCFGRGSTDEPLTWIHLLRNAGLIVLVVIGLFSRSRTADPASAD